MYTLYAQSNMHKHVCYSTQEMREVHGYGDSGEDYTEAIEACMNGGPIDHVRVWLKDTLATGPFVCSSNL
jgi:hypothetical protein